MPSTSSSGAIDAARKCSRRKLKKLVVGGAYGGGTRVAPNAAHLTCVSCPSPLHASLCPTLSPRQVTSPTLVVGKSCRKKNLAPCTCYEFRVRAASAWGWSGHCDPVMVVTLPSAGGGGNWEGGGAAGGEDASASPRQKASTNAVFSDEPICCVVPGMLCTWTLVTRRHATVRLTLKHHPTKGTLLFKMETRWVGGAGLTLTVDFVYRYNLYPPTGVRVSERRGRRVSHGGGEGQSAGKSKSKTDKKSFSS